MTAWMDSAHDATSHAPDHNNLLKAGHVMKHEALLASCTLRSTLEPDPNLESPRRNPKREAAEVKLLQP